LDRFAVGLNLPTVIAGPVVFNSEFDIHVRSAADVGERLRLTLTAPARVSSSAELGKGLSRVAL
jgi:hypothetical protein